MAIEQENERRLRWEGSYNARDLGGYPTKDGKETRWGAIVRSDLLSRLTPAGRAALIAYGIHTIIDLRMPTELATEPPPFDGAGAHPGITYLNLPLLDVSVNEPLPESDTLAQGYILRLDRFRDRVAAIMTAIARAPEGGVLVHCHAGKDRTGLVSAILLELAGVPREIVAQDYALTLEYLRPLDEEWLANGPGERAERERLLKKYSPTAEAMLIVLQHLDERYGGVEGYLLGSGVTPEDIDRLRRRLVPDQPLSTR